MKREFSVIILLLYILAVASADKIPRRVLRERMPPIVFVNGQQTVKHRGAPVDQMVCLQGDSRMAQTAMCKIVEGSTSDDVTWKCEMDLPEGVRLGEFRIICEGWTHADDLYYATQTCQLEYNLVGKPIQRPPPPPPPQAPAPQAPRPPVQQQQQHQSASAPPTTSNQCQDGNPCVSETLCDLQGNCKYTLCNPQDSKCIAEARVKLAKEEFDRARAKLDRERDQVRIQNIKNRPGGEEVIFIVVGLFWLVVLVGLVVFIVWLANGAIERRPTRVICDAPVSASFLLPNRDHYRCLQHSSFGSCTNCMWYPRSWSISRCRSWRPSSSANVSITNQNIVHSSSSTSTGWNGGSGVTGTCGVSGASSGHYEPTEPTGKTNVSTSFGTSQSRPDTTATEIYSEPTAKETSIPDVEPVPIVKSTGFGKSCARAESIADEGSTTFNHTPTYSTPAASESDSSSTSWFNSGWGSSSSSSGGWGGGSKTKSSGFGKSSGR